MSELFGPIFVPDALRDAVSGSAWLEAMLEAEGALAAARGIEARFDAADVDLAEIAREGRAVGNPVEPLVRALREHVPEAHVGATSQDILDTAAMLVARNARALILAELAGVADASSRLADEHRATVMPARTLMQQAVPTTFGLKAAVWLDAVSAAEGRLAGWVPVASLGGAAGTLALLGDDGLDVLRAYADRLALAEPAVPWHATRTPVRELVAALDLAAAACAKVALDVILLAQTEVGEVRVPGGGSSTMPHKRNPVGPVLARACALRVHALAAVFTGEHELERAAGAWHAEWESLSDVLGLTGAAAFHVRETLDRLEVDPERMRANLRAEATSEGGVGVAPEDYLGSASAFVDRALARRRGA